MEQTLAKEVKNIRGKLINDRKNKALEQAIIKRLTYFYNQEINEDDSIIQEYLTDAEFGRYKGYRNKASAWKWCMVTINPREGTTVEELMKKIDKMYNKKWINKIFYCLEWRDGNKGLHAHCKIWNGSENKRISEVCRECRNTFSDLVDEFLCVNFKFQENMKREDCFEDYIAGRKEGEDKHNMEENRAMRDMYHIADTIVKEKGKYNPIDLLADTQKLEF